MAKVFVTGATGYIGSHVCKALKQSGYEVVGLDRVPRDHVMKHMDRFIEADYHSAVCFDAMAYEKPDAVELLAQVSDEQLNNYLAEAEPIGAEDILFDTDLSDADFFVLDPITTDTTF